MAPKFVELHERLFIRSHTKSVSVGALSEAMRERGIFTVINVALIHDYDLEEYCNSVGITYIHHAMSDSRTVDKKGAEGLIQKVVADMKFHGVVVHCDSGKNRSCLIAIPALAIVTQKSPEQWIEAIRRVRPRILDNPTFEKFVMEYDYATIASG